jgi:hypothetical protein
MKRKIKNLFSELSKSNRGRVNLLIVALIIIVSGLIMNKSWWQVGFVILIVLFVNAYIKYTTLD